MSPEFDKLYVFGDSFSDTGSVFNFTGGAFPNTPYAPGRFSNGPVWTDAITNKNHELHDHYMEMVSSQLGNPEYINLFDKPWFQAN